MEIYKKETMRATFSFLLLLLLMISSSQLQVPRVEASICRFPSKNFKGICMSDTNCANICLSEGFTGGNCDGLRRRCLCQKPC